MDPVSRLVLDRLPDIDFAVPTGLLARSPSPWLRGLAEPPARFTPARGLGGGRR
ncbi:hypothetical protein ABZ454_36320 [Streptomyces sp. NPDC005803]|uniref:hypothetical protein n=1 Tax=Streptomyces sp. NPDC005803 TaxID=3154297 RepID=UPI0033DF3EAD